MCVRAQESLVNRLWKRIEQLEAEKRLLLSRHVCGALSALQIA